MDSGIDKRFLTMFLMFLVTFVAFAVYVIFNEPIAKFTQAKDELVPSSEKSLIFIWPLDLESNGEDSSEVTVFVRNIKGRGMSNKQVQLTSTVGTVKPPRKSTDTQGKVVFQISSENPGLAEIEALVDNVTIQKDVSIQFR
jgi:hypothetical protein